MIYTIHKIPKNVSIQIINFHSCQIRIFVVVVVFIELGRLKPEAISEKAINDTAGTARAISSSSGTSPNLSKGDSQIEWFKGRIEALESDREKDATKI